MHHATILELNSESYRIRAAKDNQENLSQNAAAQLLKKDMKQEGKNIK